MISYAVDTTNTCYIQKSFAKNTVTEFSNTFCIAFANRTCVICCVISLGKERPPFNL